MAVQKNTPETGELWTEREVSLAVERERIAVASFVAAHFNAKIGRNDDGSLTIIESHQAEDLIISTSPQLPSSNVRYRSLS